MCMKILSVIWLKDALKGKDTFVIIDESVSDLLILQKPLKQTVRGFVDFKVKFCFM